MFATASHVFKNKDIRKRILFTLLPCCSSSDLVQAFRYPVLIQTALIAGMEDNSLFGDDELARWW